MKRQSTLLTNLATTMLATSVALAAASAWAHDSAENKKAAVAAISTDEHAFGREGDPRKVTRTININMNDTMRYTPSEITIKQGETVRIVAHNKGNALHEMVIGTMDELKAHGELMKQNPGMEHDEPYMAHVAPGGKAELVWQFTKAGDFNFGCLAPGHFEAGMVGKIKVTKG
jgi:uncharacterized cupredoxin-like copper-binding protein